MPDLKSEAPAPVETLYIDDGTAACDGGDGPLGHPRVFLSLGEEGRIDCPYCGRRYIRNRGDKRKSDGAAGH